MEQRCTTSSSKDKSKRDNSILNSSILFPELNCTTPNIGNENDIAQNLSFRESQESFDDNENEEESMEERLAREQQESEELARQLMAEEAMASYNLSVNYLRDNADAFSPEDLEALNIALAPEEEEEEEDYEEVSEELSYDAMLQLGERLGDVKEERWRMISQREIAKLPTMNFNGKHVGNDDDSLQRCLVCQCCYEEGDCIRKLPCNHYFHKECVDQWLHSKDFCPYCRQSIV